MTRQTELESLRSQTVILEKKGAHSKYLPTVFSQEGIAMIASVLKSESAVTPNFCQPHFKWFSLGQGDRLD